MLQDNTGEVPNSTWKLFLLTTQKELEEVVGKWWDGQRVNEDEE